MKLFRFLFSQLTGANFRLSLNDGAGDGGGNSRGTRAFPNRVPNRQGLQRRMLASFNRLGGVRGRNR